MDRHAQALLRRAQNAELAVTNLLRIANIYLTLSLSKGREREAAVSLLGPFDVAQVEGICGGRLQVTGLQASVERHIGGDRHHTTPEYPALNTERAIGLEPTQDYFAPVNPGKMTDDANDQEDDRYLEHLTEYLL